MRRLVLARRAQRDLDAIRDYIAQDNLRRAESFLVELLSHIELLLDFPFSYPVISRRGWRRAVHEAYVILFTVTDREVRVQRVVHGATRR